MNFKPSFQSLLCVHGNYDVFEGISLEQVLHQWIKIDGEAVQEGLNKFTLFQNGVEVGFLTQTVVWEKSDVSY